VLKCLIVFLEALEAVTAAQRDLPAHAGQQNSSEAPGGGSDGQVPRAGEW